MATDKTSTITARIPTEQKKAIDKACKQTGISKSEYIKGLMKLQNEKAEETIEKFRVNPGGGEFDTEGFVKAMGFTALGIALLSWLGNQMEDPNDLNQFTRG